MNTQPKHKPTLKQWLTIGGIAVALVLAVVMILINRQGPKNDDWVPVIPGETNMAQDLTDTDLPVDDHSPDGTTGMTDPSPSITDGQIATTEHSQTNTPPVPTLGDEDPYENWLASAMIIGISMQYSDFEFLGIYTASQTPVSAHDASKGAYVVFKGNGETLALQSVPLSAERSDRGTSDLYVPAIGYATYDLMDPNAIVLTGLTEVSLEALEELIIASSQVSIIER